MRFILLAIILLSGCATAPPTKIYTPDIRTYTITCCGSMLPEISNGDMVHIDFNYPFEKLKVGDIIDFRAGDRYILHRIIRKNNKGWVTKGDNNRFEDGVVTNEDNFRGKMVGMDKKNKKIVL